MGTKKPKENIIFKRNIVIGAADAENDDSFLEECFVETGDLDILLDCNDPRRIVVGRTGTGKTALLKQVEKTQENVINLPPEALSISHISNSNILAFFEEIGLRRIEEFYVLLWKHVICVELLRKKFDIYNEHNQKSFLDRISHHFSDKKKKKAFEYVEKFGDKFWEETQHRIVDITTTIENELKASLGGKYEDIHLSADAAKKLNETQKKECVAKAVNAVDRIQLRELHTLVDWLAEDIFTDPQQKYYLIIDRLDEDWVIDDQLKYKLIKALIETVRSFNKVKSVKILVSLRSDLLHRVIEKTSGTGFQYEKYESQLLKLKWNQQQLRLLLDKRVEFLFKEKYQKSYEVSLKDILTENKIDTVDPIKYLLDRTFHRPREAIAFFNECLEAAEGKSEINRNIIKKAESNYSFKRLREIKTEWGKNYPCIEQYLSILKEKTREFSFSSLGKQDFESLAIELACNDNHNEDPMGLLADACFLDGKLDKAKCDSLPTKLFRILYEIGLIGMKQNSYEKMRWSFVDEPSVTEEEFRSETTIKIHPAYWMVLGIKPKSAAKKEAKQA